MDVDRRIASAPALYRSTFDKGEPRFAVVHGARHADEVEAYLPSNYALMEAFESPTSKLRVIVIIGGVDNAGWTLDDYVIPRLASGSMIAQEIES